MRAIWWKEWAELFPGADMAAHPVVVAIARRLADNMRFLNWMGHEHPVVMSLEPIALIVVATLCRIRVRYGKWDAKPTMIPVRPDRFDETIGVPGMMDGLWAGDLVESVDRNGFIMRGKPGAFPKNYDETLEKRSKAQEEASLAAVRQSVLIGMASPDRKPTPEA